MERDRIAELDVLRFTAAASVVLFHATYWPAQPNLLTDVFTFGFLGVPLFFTISGFVILMTAQNRNGIEFVNSRIARLYPSFWICVLLSTLALGMLGDGWPSLAVIAANLTMQPRMIFHQPYIDPVYWTLVVEMKFYALMWVLIVTKQMKRIEFFLTLWLGAAAVTTVFTPPHWFTALTIPMWASLFAGGCCLYLIRSRGATTRRLVTFCRQRCAVHILVAAIPGRVHAFHGTGHAAHRARGDAIFQRSLFALGDAQVVAATRAHLVLARLSYVSALSHTRHSRPPGVEKPGR